MVVDQCRQDLRYAFRMLTKNPAFSTLAVACLALGIGASTAIFSLMNAVMLKSLPVRNPEQLVLFQYVAPPNMPREMRWSTSGYGRTSFAYPMLEAFRRSRSLSGVFGFVPLGFNHQSVSVKAGSQTDVAGGEMVTAGYFPTLGITPLLGRFITAEDTDPGAPPVAVVSFRYWSPLRI